MVKRFDYISPEEYEYHDGMKEDPDGDYVWYEEYKKLQQELDKYRRFFWEDAHEENSN